MYMRVYHTHTHNVCIDYVYNACTKECVCMCVRVFVCVCLVHVCKHVCVYMYA